MKRYAIILCLLLAGCDADPLTRDQCLRREIFKQCMTSPNGNPADCDSAAAYQAIAPRSTIKPECRV